MSDKMKEMQDRFEARFYPHKFYVSRPCHYIRVFITLNRCLPYNANLTYYEPERGHDAIAKDISKFIDKVEVSE